MTRHVWVRLTDGDAAPGLVISWHRDQHGWNAVVTYLLGDDRACTKVLPATALSPVQVHRPNPGYGTHGHMVLPRPDV